MKSVKFLLRMIAACLVIGAVSTLAIAQKPIEPSATGGAGAGRFIGMSAAIGLARGEAVSLNFTNVARYTVQVQLNFLDANGRILKSSTEAVSPSESVALNFSATEITDGTAFRTHVRGVVVINFSDTERADPQLAISALEVFEEATGKTSFALILPFIQRAAVDMF
jgi:hypothetical protein